jgi:hypothetical protein
MKKTITLFCFVALLCTMSACSEGVSEASPGGADGSQTEATAVTETTNQTVGSAEISIETPAPNEVPRETLTRDPSLEECCHRMTYGIWPWFGYEHGISVTSEFYPIAVFCNEEMTLSGVPEYMPIKFFQANFSVAGEIDPSCIVSLEEAGFYWHAAVFEKNGLVVENGFIEAGMTVRVYHHDYLLNMKFYGEYVVQELTQPQYRPLYLEVFPDQHGMFVVSEMTLLVERGTPIYDVLAQLNGTRQEEAALLNQGYVSSVYSVRSGNRQVTSGTFEEGMVLRRDGSGWIQSWGNFHGERYEGARFTDYVVVFI